MANLSVADLNKRDNWNLFLKKIKDSIPFESDFGEIVVGHKNKKDNDIFYDKVKDIKPTELKKSFLFEKNSIVLPTVNGKTISLGKLKKTKEFGSAGNTTAKEDFALKNLQELITKIKKETGLIEIPFKMQNKILMVYDAITTPGTPKSDFHLVDKNGKEIFWISHKDGKTAKDFQQWGGISEKETTAHNNEETTQFILDCKAMFGDKIPNATTVAKKIKSDKLKCIAVYGIEYGKSFGRQNVNVCLQGNIEINKTQNKYYTLNADGHINWNGEVPSGSYEPVFMVIYKGDRDQFGIKGARFSISPEGCRKITKWIK